MRMSLRRLTRLTNAYSKKWQYHEAAIALHFAYYNFCRVHSSLSTMPAAANEIMDYVWSVAELVEKVSRNCFA